MDRLIGFKHTNIYLLLLYFIFNFTFVKAAPQPINGNPELLKISKIYNSLESRENIKDDEPLKGKTIFMSMLSKNQDIKKFLNVVNSDIFILPENAYNKLPSNPENVTIVNLMQKYNVQSNSKVLYEIYNLDDYIKFSRYINDKDYNFSTISNLGTFLYLFNFKTQLEHYNFDDCLYVNKLTGDLKLIYGVSCSFNEHLYQNIPELEEVSDLFRFYFTQAVIGGKLLDGISLNKMEEMNNDICQSIVWNPIIFINELTVDTNSRIWDKLTCLINYYALNIDTNKYYIIKHLNALYNFTKNKKFDFFNIPLAFPTTFTLDAIFNVDVQKLLNKQPKEANHLSAWKYSSIQFPRSSIDFPYKINYLSHDIRQFDLLKLSKFLEEQNVFFIPLSVAYFHNEAIVRLVCPKDEFEYSIVYCFEHQTEIANAFSNGIQDKSDVNYVKTMIKKINKFSEILEVLSKLQQIGIVLKPKFAVVKPNGDFLIVPFSDLENEKSSSLSNAYLAIRNILLANDDYNTILQKDYLLLYHLKGTGYFEANILFNSIKIDIINKLLSVIDNENNHSKSIGEKRTLDVNELDANKKSKTISYPNIDSLKKRYIDTITLPSVPKEVSTNEFMVVISSAITAFDPLLQVKFLKTFDKYCNQFVIPTSVYGNHVTTAESNVLHIHEQYVFNNYEHISVYLDNSNYIERLSVLNNLGNKLYNLVNVIGTETYNLKDCIMINQDKGDVEILYGLSCLKPNATIENYSDIDVITYYVKLVVLYSGIYESEFATETGLPAKDEILKLFEKSTSSDISNILNNLVLYYSVQFNSEKYRLSNLTLNLIDSKSIKLLLNFIKSTPKNKVLSTFDYNPKDKGKYITRISYDNYLSLPDENGVAISIATHKNDEMDTNIMSLMKNNIISKQDLIFIPKLTVKYSSLSINHFTLPESKEKYILYSGRELISIKDAFLLINSFTNETQIIINSLRNMWKFFSLIKIMALATQNSIKFSPTHAIQALNSNFYIVPIPLEDIDINQTLKSIFTGLRYIMTDYTSYINNRAECMYEFSEIEMKFINYIENGDYLAAYYEIQNNNIPTIPLEKIDESAETLCNVSPSISNQETYIQDNDLLFLLDDKNEIISEIDKLLCEDIECKTSEENLTIEDSPFEPNDFLYTDMFE